MKLSDRIEIAGTRRREDGALIVDARVARTGIQIYRGYEVGKPEMQTVRVFRSADEVFSQDTLASFAHRPVTNDHPSDLVTADTWKHSDVVGHTSDEVAAERIFVRVPLMVSDGDMIRDIENGKRELSAGYTCDLDFTAGTTQAGEQYDAVQKNIRVNHVAVVKHGRAGKDVRIGDQNEAPKMKTILIDNLPVQVGDDHSEAFIQRHIKNLSDSLTAANATIVERDTKIGTLTADLATAKGQIPDQAKIAQMVADRVALETHVKTLAPDFKIAAGMTDAAIKRAVVKAKFGDTVNDQMNDDTINGMFMTLKAADNTNGADNYRQDAISTGGEPVVNKRQAGFDQMMKDAWKGSGDWNGTAKAH